MGVGHLKQGGRPSCHEHQIATPPHCQGGHMVLGLSKEIIKDRRQYYINKVKTPLMRVIIKLCMRYPVPTKENCKWPNAHALIDVWCEFFQYEDNPAHPDPEKHPDFGREALFRAIERITICEYEHDHYYRDRMDWFVEKLVEKYLSGEWHPRMPIRPDRRVCWDEPIDQDRMLSWLEWQKYREAGKSEQANTRRIDTFAFGR